MVFAVAIGVFVLLVAILIQQWVFVVAEEERHFWGAVGAFLVLFVVSSFAIAWLTPKYKAQADVGAMVDAWVGGPSGNVVSAPSDLPLYGN